MRKILLVALLLTFLFPHKTFSQTPSRVEYELPYPGLLPGNPIYPLKALRDKIFEIIIADPLKKSEYHLLQADKRLAAAALLFEKGEEEKGEQTLSKGINYLEKSISVIDQAKEQRQEVGEIAGKIKTSSRKHVEIINNLIKQSDGEMRQKLEKNLQRALELEKKAEELSPS